MNSRGLYSHYPRTIGTVVLLIVVCSLTGSLAGQQKYDSKGKRDPFQNLRSSRRQAAPKILEPPPFDQRPPGLAGLLISEVNPVGAASRGDESLVILKGADDVTYMARSGSKLYDGHIKVIGKRRVVFEREIMDTAGNKTIREEIKQF